MPAFNRRRFLDQSRATTLGLAAGTTILANPKSVRATPANNRLVLGIIGVGGGRAPALAHGFLKRGDCEISYLCDVNRRVLEPRAKQYATMQGGKLPKCTQDFRELLQDDSSDAVIACTPPHWHSLLTIRSCQAGKDVYCEKPQSQTAWEGAQAVKAARKYDRIVQIGTQNRSAPYNFAAKQYLEEGKLGKIHLCRVYDQSIEPDFKWGPDSEPPATLNWDMWNGPAPQRKYNKLVHRQWRQLWDYSGGQMSYQGIHQLDLARWLCGVDYPSTVSCLGKRYNPLGGAETPDIQMATFDFADQELVMSYEQTTSTPYMLRSDGGVRDGDIFPYWPQNGTRIEIFGEKGVMFVGRMGGGWQVFVRTKGRKPVVKAEMFGRYPLDAHLANFVESVRKRTKPNADVEEGHRSLLLAHYANISSKLGGRQLKIDPKTELILDDSEAMGLLKREYRKPWVVPEVV